MRQYEEEGISKVVINTHRADMVGTFYDNPSSDNGVILFPGFTEHRVSLEDLALKLSEHFKAWTFDLNSQGESSGNWNLTEMVESISEIEKFLKIGYGLEKVGAFGNSMGGLAVGITAAREPEGLDCICLSTTLGGVQDYIPKWAVKFLKGTPQSMIRGLTILLDKFMFISNADYIEKTHSQFRTEDGYQSYAQFGATKIPDIGQMMEWIERAPRLYTCAENISQPVLLVYGGSDKLNGIRRSKLPEKVQRMYDSISAEKDILIAKGADHSLNRKTGMDDCFNRDYAYAYVQKAIVEHFCRYLE